MNADRLLAHYEKISDAPDAIPRLRRFILDLAVRGKLVPQDPNDEPASELLKRIATEKARLVKAGEIRKEKPLPEIETDELQFAAPRGWKWARIRKVTSDRGQMVPDQDFTYVDVTAINKEVGRIEEAKVTSASEAPSRARKIICQGDVLYSCVRPYLLNIAIVETDISPPPIASTAFAVLNGFGSVLPRYQRPSPTARAATSFKKLPKERGEWTWTSKGFRPTITPPGRSISSLTCARPKPHAPTFISSALPGSRDG